MPTIRPRAAKATPLPPCAVCGEPGSNGFWGNRVLCDACFRRWWADSPNLTALEEAHAAKYPDDVEARHTAESGRVLVLLKDGVTERIAGDWSNAWVERERARAQRRSA